MKEDEHEPREPDRPEPLHPFKAALREPSLRAAMVAFGAGVVWAALVHWRRSRPEDPW
jgi:hypothetical protein